MSFWEKNPSHIQLLVSVSSCEKALLDFRVKILYSIFVWKGPTPLSCVLWRRKINSRNDISVAPTFHSCDRHGSKCCRSIEKSRLTYLTDVRLVRSTQIEMLSIYRKSPLTFFTDVRLVRATHIEIDKCRLIEKSLLTTYWTSMFDSWDRHKSKCCRLIDKSSYHLNRLAESG
jgi:hypothetical protein